MLKVRTLFILKFGGGGGSGNLIMWDICEVLADYELWNCENSANLLKNCENENDQLVVDEFELLVS